MKKESQIAPSQKIAEKDIVALIREAIVPCYGIKEIANISQTKGKKEEGIKISFHADNTFTIDLYVVVVYGLKITETIRSCQKLVKFILNHYYPNMCHRVNVYAYDLAS